MQLLHKSPPKREIIFLPLGEQLLEELLHLFVFAGTGKDVYQFMQVVHRFLPSGAGWNVTINRNNCQHHSIDKKVLPNPNQSRHTWEEGENPMADRKEISAATRAILLKMQINELTESIVYTKVAKQVSDEHNSKVLLKIAAEEQRHAEIWKGYTKVVAKPKLLRTIWFPLLARIFGFTFALKLMERGEGNASEIYATFASEVPEAEKIAKDEDRHEQELLAMLDEERLQYVGSMVLGLSDALVELSGTLAGLTFAMQNTRLIALSGLITGISATLSMASSEYLSSRSEGNTNAFKSGLYTGVVYLATVAFLVLPYLLLPNTAFMLALGIMLGTVVLIILVFTYYISVAKDVPFLKRFGEMATISLSVAALSFVIGIIVKKTLGIEI